ncbi:MAG TPA: DUF2017 family protein [Actinomycetota bacterium]|nr:DUF2017 family protein [Actinomycetota bacterium]
MTRTPPRVTRTRRGEYRLRLPPGERDLLRTLPGQLRELLGTDDPALERLFPPAYPDDAQREAEYAGMVRDELAAGRRSALDVMESTIDAERLNEEQVLAWLGALNDLRLVLGTRLDVTEETYARPIPQDDPSAAQLALYHYLSWLQEQVVEALAAGLPS